MNRRQQKRGGGGAAKIKKYRLQCTIRAIKTWSLQQDSVAAAAAAFLLSVKFLSKARVRVGEGGDNCA